MDRFTTKYESTFSNLDDNWKSYLIEQYLEIKLEKVKGHVDELAKKGSKQ